MSAATLINVALRRERDLTRWVPFYTSIVSVVGFSVALNALTRYKGDWLALALFACAAAIAELTSVKLFHASRSRISIVAVITIASIAVLEPWGGVLVSLMGGLMTVVTTSEWFNRTAQPQKRATWWRRCTFNMSMRMLSALCASTVYLWTGGIPGTVTIIWAIPSLLFAVIADEIASDILLITVIHLQTGRRFIDIWRQDWEWSYPITIASSVIGGAGIAFAFEKVGIVGLGIFMMPIIATGYAFHLYANRTRSYVDQLETANRKLDEANLGLLQTLAAVVDAYDIYTFGHSAQVARYAEAIAKAIGLPPEEQTKIFRGGLIHDVGKVGVTDAIIGKRGRLTEQEYNALKQHTVIGAEIVGQMPQFQELVPLVRSHHERWDGRGYPDGLKGEENPLAARIMCLADSVEAMLSDRPYQSTRSLAEVLEEVKRCSGSQFDPRVVEAFLEVTKRYGDRFFLNSASTVAKYLEESGALDTLDSRCYVKKSMISLHLRTTNPS